MSWDPPPRGWFKVNIDDSMQDNNIGARFVVRNDIGGLVQVAFRLCAVGIGC